MTVDALNLPDLGDLEDHHLDALRQLGDPEADGLAATLKQQHPNLDERDIVRLVLDQILPGTDPAAGATQGPVTSWMREGPALPGWTDLERIQAGQDFFGDWPMPIASSLFCVSLPSAYAAANGTQVLAMTSDLATKNLARRIAETGQMLFDVMDLGRESPEALLPGGQGYLTLRGVRLLHGVVRRTLLATLDGPPVGSAADADAAEAVGDGDLVDPVAAGHPTVAVRWQPEWGLPVNQEDLLGTLITFTVAVFRGMDRMGIPYDRSAAEDYLHTWCVVGHLLGIQPQLLPFDRAQAEHLADVIARRHHQRSEAGRRLTTALLAEMETAMPLGMRKLPRTLMWHMLPGPVPTVLDVPRAAWWRPALGAMARVGPAIGHLPLGTWLMQQPTALLGRGMLRMLVDRTMEGAQPSFRLDAHVLDRLSITTSPVRQSLRCRRRRRRERR